MYPIIGISGKYGAGKDTVAEIIREMYPEYAHERFAANVKKVTAIVTGTTEEEQYTREGKATIPEGMEHSLAFYQQKIGGGIRELIDDEVWVRSVLNKKGKMVITDTRYKSEVRAIEARGGIVLRIERPNCSDEFCQGRDPNHSSEIDLDDWPFDNYIVNDGDINLLRLKIFRFFRPTSISVSDEGIQGQDKMVWKCIEEKFEGNFHQAFVYAMNMYNQPLKDLTEKKPGFSTYDESNTQSKSKEYLNEFLTKGQVIFSVLKSNLKDCQICISSALQ